jgi:hypothetical protein
MRRQSLSFFYTDVYLDYSSYTAVLTAWYPAVADGGLMMGSRFDERSTGGKTCRFDGLSQHCSGDSNRGGDSGIDSGRNRGSGSDSSDSNRIRDGESRVTVGSTAAPVNVFATVEWFADSIAHTYLVTYSEGAAAPAYYIFKQAVRVRRR